MKRIGLAKLTYVCTALENVIVTELLLSLPPLSVTNKQNREVNRIQKCVERDKNLRKKSENVEREIDGHLDITRLACLLAG